MRWANTAALIALSLIIQGPAHAVDYIPYAGKVGYQEIELGNNTYYVAFHGDNKTSHEEVDAGWLTRSAQLCQAAGMNYFLELKYSFEPVAKSDPNLSQLLPEPSGHFLMASGYIYIPMYIPRNSGAASIDAFSRKAHIRCIRDPDDLLDPKRAITVDAVLTEARTRGWGGAGNM
jgi:hypothetical protein